MTRSTRRLFTIDGMSLTAPMTPGLITGVPIFAGSLSTNPTSSTPSSLRRS